MSKRTSPVPIIGSQNWGSTLNNYLRTQEGRQSEIENEIKNIYDQSNNVVQTVLSSGINGTTIRSIEDFGNFSNKVPGLYYLNGDNPEKVNNGSQLTAGTNYYYIANATIVADANLVSNIKLLINIDTMTLDRKYDACYVYAVYNNSASSGSWEIKYSEINETSLNLSPYYICLGIIVKIDSLYYWNYKTMASNLSISSKKWMLDEPHASLTTYFNITKSGSNGINIGPYANANQKCELSVQALGINPFTEMESGISELNADIKDFEIASYPENSTAENSITYNFGILYNGTNLNDYDAYISATSAVPTITNLQDGNYRLLATALETGNKRPLLILQKANNGDGDLDKALFNDNDFGNILYYADATELYRIKIGDAITMVASAGNGISPINANGLNPHITTLIKNDDSVRFGESTGQSFHFNTKNNNNPNNALELIVPKTINNNTSSIILTNNMDSTESIELHTNKIINLETNYSSIHLDNGILLSINEPPAKNTAFTINCIKGEYASSSSFLADKIEFRTPQISIFQFSDDSPNITFSRNSSLINSQGIKLTSYTTQLQSSSMIELKSNNIQLISSINTNPAKIKFDLSNRNDPRICLGLATGDGDETYLSPRGLYFPSSNDIEGIRIGELKGGIFAVQTIVEIPGIILWENYMYRVENVNFSQEWLDLNKDFRINIEYTYNNNKYKVEKISYIKKSNGNGIEFNTGIWGSSTSPWISIGLYYDRTLVIESGLDLSNIKITTTNPIFTGNPLLEVGKNSSIIKIDNNNTNATINVINNNKNAITNIINNKGIVNIGSGKIGIGCNSNEESIGDTLNLIAKNNVIYTSTQRTSHQEIINYLNTLTNNDYKQYLWNYNEAYDKNSILILNDFKWNPDWNEDERRLIQSHEVMLPYLSTNYTVAVYYWGGNNIIIGNISNNVITGANLYSGTWQHDTIYITDNIKFEISYGIKFAKNNFYFYINIRGERDANPGPIPSGTIISVAIEDKTHQYEIKCLGKGV